MLGQPGDRVRDALAKGGQLGVSALAEDRLDGQPAVAGVLAQDDAGGVDAVDDDALGEDDDPRPDAP